MKRYNRKFIEAKQVGTLYHFTSFIKLPLILQRNELMVGQDGYVSFTRDKHFLSKSRYSLSMNQATVGCAIIIDGDKLSNNYKITPYDYFDAYNTFYNQKSSHLTGEDESEETVNKSIKNLNRYILGIIIYKNLYERDGRVTKVLNGLFDEHQDEYLFKDYISYIKKFKYRIEIK